MTLVKATGCSPVSTSSGLLILLLLVANQPNHARAAVANSATGGSGESILDNLISGLMSTAETAKSYLDIGGFSGDREVRDQQAGPPASMEAEVTTGSFFGHTTSTAGGNTVSSTVASSSMTIDGQTPFWNPFNWLKPRAVSIPYNPDTDLSTPEIAVRHGYNAESHTLKTVDGYLLTLHRIPCGRTGCASSGKGTGQPVFLQHGLLSSSADWLLSGPEKALAFILADAGYDVWLGNARGNTYSRKHVSMSSDETAFWDFSWHEMALFDIPAEIDFVYAMRELEHNATDRNLLYVGHSMGTTMAFVLLASRPEYNDRIEAVFAMAPVAFMGHVKSPIRLLAPFSNDIEIPLDQFPSLHIPNWVDGFANDILKRLSLRLLMILKFFGSNEFMPQNKIIRYLAKYGCELTEAEKYICENTVFVLCGFDKEQYNATLMPVIFGHTPAGTSTKTVVHYAQEIHEHGNFQQFDYGEAENQRRYGQSKPPSYDLDSITTPIALFYANNDWLAGPMDVANLFSRLTRTSIGMFRVPNDNFNHVDFLWGNDAPEVVYKQLVMLMQRYK
ncbi:lipase 3-like isoform X1 [Topomyia yanbarensis]|uniref:lipase 3-like isoform X1 n=1 Tax=Topomyia yanbarensis TaxID=2498891 RepID=UPI00273B429E|nr:lipase 3-like isoform X1 [Topomyia yanbarensis]XP_058839896.1 lipase 3-like isoform X1 [Topomyia yanbarensis]XP_058839897.1 lipase 3-like isoform X1 [Topomyia yanbarensis]